MPEVEWKKMLQVHSPPGTKGFEHQAQKLYLQTVKDSTSEDWKRKP